MVVCEFSKTFKSVPITEESFTVCFGTEMQELKK